MRTILLVDGDEYLFKATAAVEREIRWDEWNHVLYANENEAWDNFTRMVGQLATTYSAKPEDTVLCFGGSQPYFRHELHPTYKGGRPGRKPLCYAALRERCEQGYIVRSYPAIEADDCLGILATRPAVNDHSRQIICSQDKDMLTVPGWLHREGELSHIAPSTAHFYHMGQTLTGDHVDNYPGCPGFGPKRTHEWLSTHGAEWPSIVRAYESKGLTEADALLQARLARILQWSDWDYERKQPILWEPPNT